MQEFENGAPKWAFVCFGTVVAVSMGLYLGGLVVTAVQIVYGQ